MAEQTFQKRQVAHKVNVSGILNAGFAKDEVSAGYIKLGDVNVSRVNVLATVVHKSEGAYANAVVDDGTGKISLRTFDNSGIFSKADVGDFVLIIGRIREFNNEKYIIPEILKKINIEWVNVRKLELKNSGLVEENAENKISDVHADEKAAGIDGEVYLLIKRLDSGEGVPVDELIKSSNNTKAEAIINKLMESGDIFEIKPGRLKVLE